jgi:hypothetical protein
LAQPRLSQQAVALQDLLSHFGPKSPSSSTPPRSATHSLLGNLPCRTCYREIGPREIARPTVLSLRERTPKSRWSKVNLGVFPLATRALTSQFPECQNSDLMRACHLDSTIPLGSHSATSASGFRVSRTHDSQSPVVGNPECRIPDAPDSCHLSLQEFTVPIKSGDRTSRIRRACDPCTRQPRLPICDGKGFLCCLRANCPAPSPGSDDHRTSRKLRDDPSC